jgi:hypothetical protein
VFDLLVVHFIVGLGRVGRKHLKKNTMEAEKK